MKKGSARWRPLRLLTQELEPGTGGMKVVILGATGRTGLQLVTQALARNHEVTALVRNSKKIEHIKNERLRVVKVNVRCEGDLQKAFAGHEVVLIALGAKMAMPIFGKVTLHKDTIKPIVSAMRTNAIKRMIVISSWGTVYTPNTPKLLEYVVKPLFIGRNLYDMAEMETFLLDQCSDINYTVVRPPGLTNGHITDKDIVKHEDYCVPNGPSTMSRADVARVMLECMEKSEWIQKMIAITLDNS